jgi:hypothetical protein
VTVELWPKIPSSYLICENDNAIPAHGQDGMVAYAQEKSGGKTFDHVERCSSGHSLFFEYARDGDGVFGEGRGEGVGEMGCS